ncbi:ABC transporter permease [Pseudomonadota bacterium]
MSATLTEPSQLKWSTWLYRSKPDSWTFGVVCCALLITVPVLTVFSFVFHPAGDVWNHLVETVLFDYLRNSLVLVLGVAIGVTTMGVTCAWLTTICVFPGSRVLTWALLLPMAMPAYIIAYTYTGMFDFAGPVQSFLRESFAWNRNDYWFPEIRSIGGAIAMLSLVLYPYVYLLARSAFLQQSVSIIDASRNLGYGPWRSFFKISLPIARPAIIAGLSLALMETLADYGTVQYFGVATFTTGIFRTWFGLGDSSAAAQLSAMLTGFVFVLIVLERYSRKRAKFHTVGSRSAPLSRIRLHGWKKYLALLACILPLALGFIFPAVQLSIWAWQTAAEMVDLRFIYLVLHSMELAAITATLAVLLALFFAYGERLRPIARVKTAVRVVGMGYAVPGTVIAIGVILPFAWLDNLIDDWARSSFNYSTGLLLSGTLFALVFAYLVRFLAIAIQTVEAGLSTIKPSMDDTARTLGFGPLKVLRKIHIPILRGSLLTAALLVFVDVLKELPATLVLRPFNFNTLAVRAYELASDERLADSSTAALAIVATGIIPVILISYSISHSRKRKD